MGRECGHSTQDVFSYVLSHGMGDKSFSHILRMGCPICYKGTSNPDYIGMGNKFSKILVPFKANSTGFHYVDLGDIAGRVYLVQAVTYDIADIRYMLQAQCAQPIKVQE